jgi:hypothetical protein
MHSKLLARAALSVAAVAAVQLGSMVAAQAAAVPDYHHCIVGLVGTASVVRPNVCT